MSRPLLAVVRFSALGDVALLWPVLHAVAETYPTYRITFFTRPNMIRHLPGHPRIDVVGLDVDHAYASPVALFLFWWGWLRSAQPVGWIDAHRHLRTRSGTWLARRMGIPVGQFTKHRKARRAFLNGGLDELPMVQQSYADAFADAGVPVLWPAIPAPVMRPPADLLILAPFAAHASKQWALIEAYRLASWWMDLGGRVRVLGHPSELQSWQGPEGVALGRSEKENKTWREAAVAVVMDSANQHLAALHQTPSVTLWMGTAPEAGFVPQHAGATAHVRSKNLACVPCSIYGTSTCARGDFACRNLSLDEIKEAIRSVAHTDLNLSGL